jgi:cytochrome P450 family 3 subfamily A
LTLNREDSQLIEIAIYVIHHSEQYYPNPEKFSPERFIPENRDQLVPYTYLTFGVGPRNCIGMRFALLEAKLYLAQIVKRFKIFKSYKTEVPFKFKTISPTCQTKRSLIVGIQMRSNLK